MIDFSKTKPGDKLKIVGAGAPGFAKLEVMTESIVLEPWSDGRRVPTFETRPWMFERIPDSASRDQEQT